jgi:hypothetical protein
MIAKVTEVVLPFYHFYFITFQTKITKLISLQGRKLLNTLNPTRQPRVT